MADDFDMAAEIEAARKRAAAKKGGAPSTDVAAPDFNMDEEIAAARQRAGARASGGPVPTMGRGQDAALSALSGLQEGITRLPGIIGDVQQTVRGKVKDWTGFDPAKIPALTPGMTMFGAGKPLPTGQYLQDKYTELTGGQYTHDPQYWTGDVAKTAGSFAPNLIGGEASIPLKLATRVLGPAAATEAAGAAAKEVAPEWEGTARTVTALGTGALGGGLEEGIMQGQRARAGLEPLRVAPTREQLKTESGKHYDEFLQNPVTVKKGTTNIFGMNLENTLKSKGFFDATDSAPAVHAAVRHFLKQADEPMTTGQWKAARTALGNQAFKGTGPERAAGAVAIKELDNWFKNLNKRQLAKGSIDQLDDAKRLLDKANADYASYQRSKGFSNLTRFGRVRATSVNSGMNVGNTVRSRMAGLAEAETKHPSLGLLPDELQGVEDIATGGPSQFSRENMLRNYGNMAGGGGGLGASFLGIGPALYTGEPSLALLGASIPVTGAAAKLRSNRLTMRAADKLDQQLRRRSALAKDMPKQRLSMSKDELWLRAMMLAQMQQQNQGPQR